MTRVALIVIGAASAAIGISILITGRDLIWGLGAVVLAGIAFTVVAILARRNKSR